MDKKTKKLRQESKSLKALIIIGKNGISDEVIKNIQKQLKTSRIVKVRILKTYINSKNKKSIANELASKCDAKIIDFVGFTVVLSKIL